jgi:cell division protease FtsH
MPRNNYPQRKKWRFPTLQQSLLIVTIFLGLTTLYYWLYQSVELQVTSLPHLVSAITAGHIKSLSVYDNLLIAEMDNGTKLSARKESSISTVETLQLFGLPAEAIANLPMVVEEPRAETNPRGLLLTLTVATFFSYLVIRFSPQLQGRGSGHFFNNMGRSNPRVLSGGARKGNKIECPPVTFRDVAGVEQAKLELQEVIEFLKEPAKFAKLGARVPKGVLMAGPPGTGKTLLAKAVAGEAGVPFFSISGSEFVEMFVGVGAARVRDLFKRAREQAPAVVFVDEIDAVGRQRGASLGNSNDEREHTLNQILVEMDGFGTDANVIVMASTNRPDVLDPALLRPGRFDRKVILDRPDVQSREAILGVHTRGKPLAPDISISALAKLTPGFAGADLENLVNEAAILAARRNLLLIGQQEFQDAMERIVAGPERQSKILSEHERQVVAFHEAGHAVVMYNLKYSDPVHKVSIVSRGMALGYTMPLPEGDKYLRTREAFEDEIVSLLGGRAAEEIIFQQVTTGASNDLERATKLARAMVTRYGFSKKLGLRTFGEEQGNPYLGSLGETRDYSEEMAQLIDQEMRHILEDAYQRATDILTTQQQKLEALAEALLECETIERPEFEALMA